MADSIAMSDWLAAAEESIQDTLRECREGEDQGSWYENYVTTRLLLSIGGCGTLMTWGERPIAWNASKLSGVPEHDHGDVCVLVRTWIAEKVFVDGVAFYEAKRQYFDQEGKARGFMALAPEQIQRIAANSATARVLLYDWDGTRDRGHVGSVAAQIALGAVAAGLAGGRLLMHLTRPWISDLGNVLRGFDLDHRPEAVSTAGSGKLAAPPMFFLNVATALPGLQPKLAEVDLTRYTLFVGEPAVPPKQQPTVQRRREDPGLSR